MAKPKLYPAFNHWNDYDNIFLYADPHLYDTEFDRGFTAQEQIDFLKQFAHKKDLLVILGDVGDPEPLKQLKCDKVLIKGNHDAGDENYEDYFIEIYDGPVMINSKILLSHEPIPSYPYAFNIHGHVHGDPSTWKVYPLSLNVAAEYMMYRKVLFRIKDIVELGFLRNVSVLHRETIDRATVRKQKRQNVEVKTHSKTRNAEQSLSNFNNLIDRLQKSKRKVANHNETIENTERDIQL